MTPMQLCRLQSTLISMGKEGRWHGASSGMPLVLRLTRFSKVTPSTKMMVSQLLSFPLLVLILLADLLFFDRLGPDMLPEETYHSWWAISLKGICLAHFCLGHGFPFTRMMESFRHVSIPHTSLLKVFWRSAECPCSSRSEAELVGTSNRLLLPALIPVSAVAQTTHAFTSAMLSTLEWNPKEYVKVSGITLSDLFVASPLRRSISQRCQKSVSTHLKMLLCALFTHKASTCLYTRYVDTSDPV
jgi:hypothetical protein